MTLGLDTLCSVVITDFTLLLKLRLCFKPTPPINFHGVANEDTLISTPSPEGLKHLKQNYLLRQLVKKKQHLITE
jgi:hypothetical protein